MHETEETPRNEAIRWAVLAALNDERPAALKETVLLDSLALAFFGITLVELRRETDYLRRRKLLTLALEASPPTARLTRHGIDMAEHTTECGPGIARPELAAPDATRERRESIRWYFLRALNAGRGPVPVSERLLLKALSSGFPGLSAGELRRESDYLVVRGLVESKGHASALPVFDLTRMGVDVAEHTVPCEPGIARPPKRG